LLFIFLYLSQKITVFAKNILSLRFAIYAREISIVFYYFVVKLNCCCSRFRLNMKYSTTFSLIFVTLLVFSFGTSFHPLFQCFFLFLFVTCVYIRILNLVEYSSLFFVLKLKKKANHSRFYIYIYIYAIENRVHTIQTSFY